MKKKLLSMILTGTMILSLAACGNAQTAGTATSDAGAAVSSTDSTATADSDGRGLSGMQPGPGGAVGHGGADDREEGAAAPGRPGGGHSRI